jgi:integrase
MGDDPMEYSTSVRKRKRLKGSKTEYIARLLYKDATTGRRKERSQSASSPSEAKRIVLELVSEFVGGGQVAVESHEMTFEALVKHCQETRYCDAEFDSEGRKLFGVRGKDTVESHIKPLKAFFGSLKLRDIRVANLRSYRKSRLTSKSRKGDRLSVSTVNREMSTLRAILNEAVVNDWITFNPFSKVRPGELISIADERKRETILTMKEEGSLLKACSGNFRRHLKALVMTALDTGARLGELLRLRWCDVHFDEGIIGNVTSYKGKTVHRREVPLTPRVVEALLDLKEKRSIGSFKRGRKSGMKPDNSLVFGIANNVQRSWEAARFDAKLQHIRFHDLRHTAATRMAQHMPLALVGLILGHSDPKTTHRYVNSTREIINQAGRVLHNWQEQREHVAADPESVN